MNMSKSCWFGRHFQCRYYGCVCSCHNKQSKLAKALEEVNILSKQERKNKAQFNPEVKGE